MPIDKRRVIYLRSVPFLLRDLEYHCGVGSTRRIDFCRCPVLAVVNDCSISNGIDFVNSAISFYIPFIF